MISFPNYPIARLCDSDFHECRICEHYYASSKELIEEHIKKEHWWYDSDVIIVP